MSSHQYSRRVWRASPPTSAPSHVFAVGQRVKFVPVAATVVRDRQANVALYAASFEIVRQLPRAESTLLYRVRDVDSGQERVVSEQEITSFI